MSNYRIDPGVEIEWASLEPRTNILRLYTTPLEIDKTYTLTIQGTVDPVKNFPFTLSDLSEMTFGEGDAVTFSGILHDTSLIVHPKKKMKNHNAGGEEFLSVYAHGGSSSSSLSGLCRRLSSSASWVRMGFQDASISLYVGSVENDKPQQLIIRRVLLPWKEGVQKSQPATENVLTYNSALHRNLPWNKPPAQAMLEGINGDKATDYNGFEDVGISNC